MDIIFLLKSKMESTQKSYYKWNVSFTVHWIDMWVSEDLQIENENEKGNLSQKDIQSIYKKLGKDNGPN